MVAFEQPVVDYAEWNEWDARDYLSEYYQEVMPDEQFAMQFLVESMLRLPSVPLALDFGAGPTIHHLFPLVPKVQEIHLAEYLPGNRAEIRKWIEADTEAHDWSAFLCETLRLEGRESDEEAQSRAEETRRRVTRIAPADAGDTDPLGPAMREHYPLVTTHYCAEGATNDKQQWRRYMRNIAGLVAPNGHLILSACGAADFYCVGDRRFPCAGVTAGEVLQSLEENGFRNVDLRVRHVPDHSDQGYSTVIFARAEKSSPSV